MSIDRTAESALIVARRGRRPDFDDPRCRIGRSNLHAELAQRIDRGVEFARYVQIDLHIAGKIVMQLRRLIARGGRLR